jgi:PHP family Zn ribbon phosphoesterase
MTFIADLHIHSRFSRATGKDLTLRRLARGAGEKGIDVLGTGDFTHPQWREEMRDQLVFDEESGLYRLAENAENADAAAELAGSSPFFCLQAEISSIYKRHGKVRKIHSLVYAPTLDDAERISARLGRIGNLNADGRPILGLDCRDLLELVLECAPGAVLIPAHIWTPWFSLFGSKSGFDALEDCFGDLSAHIFALETGLSSDPPMNRRVSALDGYALISNSDAHSAGNLGREANLFSGKPSFDGMFDALRAAAARRPAAGAPCEFLGTLEFCPEEGKYHLDGHRACNVALEPREAAALDNICPVCGKPLTIGVLHRVLELADRPAAPDDLPHEPPRQRS